MTTREIEERAARLGLSTWMVEAVAVGKHSRTVSLMCVGFAGIDLALGEAESWEEAFEQVTHTIFAA